jgi:hypothetical protein
MTTHTTDIHTPGGIRTHDRSRRAAVDLCLRPRGHWGRQFSQLLQSNFWTQREFTPHPLPITVFIIIIQSFNASLTASLNKFQISTTNFKVRHPVVFFMHKPLKRPYCSDLQQRVSTLKDHHQAKHKKIHNRYAEFRS